MKLILIVKKPISNNCKWILMMYKKIKRQLKGIQQRGLTYILKENNNGEWDTAQEAELYDGIQDLLEQKAKIAAIKYYRNTMLNVFKEEVKLRDAKDYVDKIESDLKDRGIIK